MVVMEREPITVVPGSALQRSDAAATMAAAVDVDARVVALVREYSTSPRPGPLDPKASLRTDLGVDSLSLVSVAVALGDDFGIDLVEWGADLSKLVTLADLVALGHSLQRASTKASS
jgi:acyl carrier protein